MFLKVAENFWMMRHGKYLWVPVLAGEIHHPTYTCAVKSLDKSMKIESRVRVEWLKRCSAQHVREERMCSVLEGRIREGGDMHIPYGTQEIHPLDPWPPVGEEQEESSDDEEPLSHRLKLDDQAEGRRRRGIPRPEVESPARKRPRTKVGGKPRAATKTSKAGAAKARAEVTPAQQGAEEAEEQENLEPEEPKEVETERAEELAVNDPEEKRERWKQMLQFWKEQASGICRYPAEFASSLAEVPQPARESVGRQLTQHNFRFVAQSLSLDMRWAPCLLKKSLVCTKCKRGYNLIFDVLAQAQAVVPVELLQVPKEPHRLEPRDQADLPEYWEELSLCDCDSPMVM